MIPVFGRTVTVEKIMRLCASSPLCKLDSGWYITTEPEKCKNDTGSERERTCVAQPRAPPNPESIFKSLTCQASVKPRSGLWLSQGFLPMQAPSQFITCFLHTKMLCVDIS